MQMMLACGAFVMSEKISRNPYLRPGIEYIEFLNAQDLYEKVEFYLNNQEAREKIVKNARQRILEAFDSRKRFCELTDGIERGRYRKFSVLGSGSALMNSIEVMNKAGRQIIDRISKCVE